MSLLENPLQQFVNGNTQENIKPNVNNKMALSNIQQEALCEALEVIPLFDRGNTPLSYYIEGCFEAKAMLLIFAAQGNLTR